jgi:hypothetical protein
MQVLETCSEARGPAHYIVEVPRVKINVQDYCSHARERTKENMIT